MANDDRIMAAALRVLREDGYDGLGMSHVARAAELKSTGALYGRFENVAELSVWVWTERAAAALRDVSERAIALLDADGIDEVTLTEAGRLASDLSEPSDTLRAAFELLAVAPRVEELDEVVRPDIEAILAGAGALPDATPRRRAQVLGQLALAWGIGLLSLPPSAPRPEWWMLVAGSIGLDHDRTRPRRTTDPVPVTPPVPDTGEPVRDVVLGGRRLRGGPDRLRAGDGLADRPTGRLLDRGDLRVLRAQGRHDRRAGGGAPRDALLRPSPSATASCWSKAGWANSPVPSWPATCSPRPTSSSG